MMLLHFRKKYILIILHLLVLSSSAHRKAKKARDLKILPPQYEVYPSDKLPSDLQVTKYLMRGRQTTFFYWSTVNGTLSVSIIPCTSVIQWNFEYQGDRIDTGRQYHETEKISTDNITTKSFFSQQGVYALSLKATENDTYVHLYISTEIGGPQALRTSHADNLRIHHKERRKSASLKWNQSLVDPQSTDYCLVISTEKHFNSLCAAQASRFELPPPQNQKNVRESTSAVRTMENWRGSLDKYTEQIDPMISCLGKKTQYTISNLKEGKTYYYNLFAINKQSNLTYPYGSVSKVFKSQIKPVSLKNGYGQAVLKGSEEEAIFRYKIGRKSENDLDIFVIPCGGPVDVKLMLKGESMLSARKIEGFRKLTLKNSIRGARYQIKVLTNSGEDYKRTTGVQIYASKRAISKIPMITVPKIMEYDTLRECHSVTVGWILVPDPKPLRYCVKAKDGRLKETDNYRIPNQCGLERRRKKSEDFETKYCKDIKQLEDGKVNTYKIRGLDSGKTYVIQVTVQKQKGKTLSYELLQVSTKRCSKRQNLE
ncbi:protein NDNF-like isoform X2 [Coccinella septempunctata]|nr:protein NDNF-like isoform X2 [Coccinella septempunctata]